jgi:hypothetical protein
VQLVLLCQSHTQGANHFRLSGYKSSNTEKLSGFAPHKLVIATGGCSAHDDPLAFRAVRSARRAEARAIKTPAQLCEAPCLADAAMRSYRAKSRARGAKPLNDCAQSLASAGFMTVRCRTGLAHAKQGTGNRIC